MHGKGEREENSINNFHIFFVKEINFMHIHCAVHCTAKTERERARHEKALRSPGIK
jgi:hypothetical protein